MTREEQIKKQADIYTDDASNYAEWSDDGGWSETNDIELVEKAFIAGAKWADKHPNLYNDEKYHTVKVSCLDELNRKAKLYDEFIDKACKWLEDYLYEYASPHEFIGTLCRYVYKKDAINEFRKAMEE